MTVDFSVETAQNDGRRIVLLDYRRAGDALSGQQVLAVIQGRLVHCAIVIDLDFAQRLRRAAAGRQRLHFRLWCGRDNNQPKIDDLHIGRRVAMAVDAGVFGVEGIGDGGKVAVLYPGFLQHGFDFERLAAIAHIGGVKQACRAAIALFIAQPPFGLTAQGGETIA